LNSRLREEKRKSEQIPVRGEKGIYKHEEKGSKRKMDAGKTWAHRPKLKKRGLRMFKRNIVKVSKFGLKSKKLGPGVPQLGMSQMEERV